MCMMADVQFAHIYSFGNRLMDCQTESRVAFTNENHLDGNMINLMPLINAI